MITQQIKHNRQKYLDVLRSGKYQKGTVLSDESGRPVIQSKEDDEGYCACAIMIHEFSPKKMNFKEARENLGISAKDCTYIQRELNDTSLSFPEIADHIEKIIF